MKENMKSTIIDQLGKFMSLLIGDPYLFIFLELFFSGSVMGWVLAMECFDVGYASKYILFIVPRAEENLFQRFCWVSS